MNPVSFPIRLFLIFDLRLLVRRCCDFKQRPKAQNPKLKAPRSKLCINWQSKIGNPKSPTSLPLVPGHASSTRTRPSQHLRASCPHASSVPEPPVHGGNRWE